MRLCITQITGIVIDDQNAFRAMPYSISIWRIDQNGAWSDHHSFNCRTNRYPVGQSNEIYLPELGSNQGVIFPIQPTDPPVIYDSFSPNERALIEIPAAYWAAWSNNSQPGDLLHNNPLPMVGSQGILIGQSNPRTNHKYFQVAVVHFDQVLIKNVNTLPFTQNFAVQYTIHYQYN